METVETVNAVKDLRFCEKGKLRKTKDLLYRGYVIKTRVQSHIRGRDGAIQRKSGCPFIKMTEKYGEYQMLPTWLVSS